MWLGCVRFMSSALKNAFPCYLYRNFIYQIKNMKGNKERRVKPESKKSALEFLSCCLLSLLVETCEVDGNGVHLRLV